MTKLDKKLSSGDFAFNMAVNIGAALLVLAIVPSWEPAALVFFCGTVSDVARAW